MDDVSRHVWMCLVDTNFEDKDNSPLLNLKRRKLALQWYEKSVALNTFSYWYLFSKQLSLGPGVSSCENTGDTQWYVFPSLWCMAIQYWQQLKGRNGGIKAHFVFIQTLQGWERTSFWTNFWRSIHQDTVKSKYILSHVYQSSVV